MDKETAISLAEKLLNNPEQTFVLSTLTEDGYPDSRLMGNICQKNIKEVYFTCQTGSLKTHELAKNPISSVYFTENNNLTFWLYGSATVTRDEAERKKIWNDRMLRIYGEGVDSPRLTVIRFVPTRLRVNERPGGYSEFEL